MACDLPSVIRGNTIAEDMWEHISNNDLLSLSRAQELFNTTMQQNVVSGMAGGGLAGVGMPPGTRAPPEGQWKPSVDYAARARELFLKRMGTVRGEMKVGANDFIT